VKLPALFVDGRIYTGYNHGEAFGKLTSEQRDNSQITSGFIDPQSQEFRSEDMNFYLKQVILIRHAQPNLDGDNPSLCEQGRLQASKTAFFLSRQIELTDYEMFCSPARRCMETSEIFRNETNITFEERDELSAFSEKETPDSFCLRLDSIAKEIPFKSVLITHSDFIISLSEVVSGLSVNFEKVPYCSLTYIKERQIIWIAKNAEV